MVIFHLPLVSSNMQSASTENDFDRMLITALISLIIFIVISHVMLLTGRTDKDDNDDMDENVDDARMMVRRRSIELIRSRGTGIVSSRL
jgi:uncharacterized membrane protein